MIVEVAPKDKALEHIAPSIKIIYSSGIVRPKAQIRTKTYMKNGILTNLTHLGAIKTIWQPIATKISPWPKTLRLTSETLDSLSHMKNWGLQKNKTTTTKLILILRINLFKLALLDWEAQSELTIDRLFPATDNRRQTVSMIRLTDIRCPIRRFLVLLKRIDTLSQLKMHR